MARLAEMGSIDFLRNNKQLLKLQRITEFLSLNKNYDDSSLVINIAPKFVLTIETIATEMDEELKEIIIITIN